MFLTYFIKGMAVGFSLALPVGPIALLCIRRTLSRGSASGLVSGLGAATADGLYGAVAGFGLTFISNFLVSHESILRILGGGFLCYAGARIFVSVPSETSSGADQKGILRDYLSALFLTLTNPVTILTFAAVFATLGMPHLGENYFPTVVLVAGVFIGSTLWWIILTGFVSVFRGAVKQEGIRMVNRVSGTVIICFGIVILVTFLFPLT